MSDRWRKFNLVLLLAVIGVVNASIQPVYRLRSEMPPRFNEPAHDGTGKNNDAHLYWASMVRAVQWRYGYGYVLPDQPPPEFTIGTPDIHGGSREAAARLHYWQKVREVWTLPGVWNEEYEFSMDWMGTDLKEAGGWLQERFAQIVYVTPSR